MAASPTRPAFRRSAFAFSLLLFAVLWFGVLNVRQLAKTDEGRYAEIGREMSASGDWVTPRLNGLKYFEKPALQYWATAAAFDLFGEHDWTARLWSALCGFATLILTGLTAARLYGRTTGIAASAILASTVLFAWMGRMNTLDMGLTFFMTGTLCGLLLTRHEALLPSGRARLWMLLAWACMALAVLSKGLIGIILPGAVWTFYLLLTREWVLLRRSEPVRGLLLFLALSAPWFIVVSVVNPEFPEFFFIHEHFARYLTAVHRRDEPWWYFFGILGLGSMPWLTMLVPALFNAWRGITQDSARTNGSPDRLLLVWAVLIFVFFSLSHSKLPSYILPIFPAIAILLARQALAFGKRALIGHFLATAALTLAMLAATSLIGTRQSEPTLVAPYTAFGHWLAAAIILLLCGVAFALRTVRRELLHRAVLAVAMVGILAQTVAISGYAQLNHSASAKYAADLILPFLRDDTTLYSIGMYEQTLPYYLKRTMTLVDHRDELDFGLNQEPQKWVPTLEALAQRWANDHSAIAVMQPDTYPKLQALKLPMRVILSDHRFVIVAKP